MTDSDSDSECEGCWNETDSDSDRYYRSYYTSDEENHLDVPFDIVPIQGQFTGGMRPRIDHDMDTEVDSDSDSEIS
jgi:hypothetical protein